MSDIIRDYLRNVRKRLHHLGLREREIVLSEIEDHLNLEMQRLRSEDKELTPDEAALKATNAFGDPADIGIAHGAQGGVVNHTTGERLLDIAILSTQAAGRSVRGIFKWSGIAAASVLGAILLFAIVFVIFGEDTLGRLYDDAKESEAHELYSYSGIWSMTDPNTEMRTAAFDVREDMKRVEISFHILPFEPSGCARVRLLAPAGTVAYDSGTGCNKERQTLTISTPGTWQVEYTFLAFHGSLSAQGWYYERADS